MSGCRAGIALEVLAEGRASNASPRLTGMPKKETVRRDIIGSEIPLYALGSRLALGVAPDQFRKR